MADRNTELRQLKEMLNEAKQIENLEKRLNKLNKKGSSRCYKEIASTNNEDQVLNKIDYEKSLITSTVSEKSISAIYWIIAAVSILATVLVTIAIFTPVAEEIYATTKIIWLSSQRVTKLGYILYIVLAVLIELIIVSIFDPCNKKKDTTDKKSSKKN